MLFGSGGRESRGFYHGCPFVTIAEIILELDNFVPLTEAGRELYPIVLKTAEWGMCWARGQMTDKELDVQLLMSDIQRRINPGKLPGGQTVIKFSFTDLDRYNQWWVKICNNDIDLCTGRAV